MAETITLNIGYNWIKEDPSCLKCVVCDDTIFSNTYRLNYSINNAHKDSTDVVVCESCFKTPEE